MNDLIQLLEREKTAKVICAELNNFVDLRHSLLTIVERIHSLTRCEAVAIRLHDSGDYPYYVYNGFPDTFIQKENSLCAKNDAGKPILESGGKEYLLECMCGNVIRGRFDPALPFFTKNGSFWSNHTSRLLASTTEADRQSRTRNTCNSCGYESVALIPIKAKGERIGLIQLNDHRIGRFDANLIEYLEMIGEHVGLAVQNSLIHTKLKNAFEEIKVLRGIIPICSNCKKIRDDAGYWQQVEVYISHHTEASFSHGICPDCIKKLYPKYSHRPKKDDNIV
ncbi:MAG: GAF domain-containing protein [Candidatus Omnitrophota bacterium]